jgi:cytochrome P450
VPAGTIVGASIYLVHRSPDLYPDPDTFRPERFLDGQPPPYAWIPFGGGTRRCLGAAFATLEMKTVIPTILRMVELAAPTMAPEPVCVRGITLVPARGCRVVVRRWRTQAAYPRAGPGRTAAARADELAAGRRG